MFPKLSSSVQGPREEPTLNEVKRRKKELDLQTQTLQNRIAQIKNDKEKLSKKIQMAEQMTLDVYAQKVAHRQKKEEKLRKASTTDNLIYQKTLQDRMYLKNMKQGVLEMKHYDAQLFKIQMGVEKQRQKEESRQQFENMRLKAALHKEEELLSQSIIAEKRMERISKIREEQYLEKQKIVEENKQKESKLRQLEEEELKMLSSLQETMQREKEAKQQYMNASKLEPEEFERSQIQQSIILKEEENTNKEETKQQSQHQEQQQQSDQEDPQKQEEPKKEEPKEDVFIISQYQPQEGTQT